MRGFLDFFKTTVIGGFFVVLPIVLIVFLLGQFVVALVDMVEPLASELPVQELGGIGVATLIAILLVVVFCFFTGLLVRTRFGIGLRDWIEGKLLNRLPGYTILRNLTHRFSGKEGTEFAPALVDLYGAGTQALALIVEEQNDGKFTVFIPLAPTPTVGQVLVVSPERLHKIDATLGSVMNSIMQWGVESKKFLSSTSESEAKESPE